MEEMVKKNEEKEKKMETKEEEERGGGGEKGEGRSNRWRRRGMKCFFWFDIFEM